MKPAWLLAEEEFAAFFHPKHDFVFPFHDARAARGAAGDSVRVFTTSHPSDFIVTATFPGFDRPHTAYCEVKSSSDEKTFSFTRIRPAQWAAAVRQTAAHGSYYFFIKAEFLKQWFWVPAADMIALRDKQGNVKWKYLLENKYAWPIS